MAKLGQALVDQLEEFDDDICSAWMAHHLARLIHEAKVASSETRNAAEDRCRAAVLEVWRHRRSLNGRQPLASADETLDAVRMLRRSDSDWYFSIASDDTTSGNEMLALARRVDNGARAILRYLLAMSFLAKAQSDQQWFDIALSKLFRDVSDMAAVQALAEDADAIFKGRDPMSERSLNIREDLRRKISFVSNLAHKISEIIAREETGDAEL